MANFVFCIENGLSVPAGTDLEEGNRTAQGYVQGQQIGLSFLIQREDCVTTGPWSYP